MRALSVRLFSAELNNGDILEKLINYIKSFGGKYAENEPMSRHTTFKIGGAARLMFFPKSTDEASNVIKFCRKEISDISLSATAPIFWWRMMA